MPNMQDSLTSEYVRDRSPRLLNELALLGALINDPSQIDIAAGLLVSKDFAIRSHGRAFDHLCLMRENGYAFKDLALALASLSQAGLIGDDGGEISHADLREASVDANPGAVPAYCELIIKGAMLAEQQRLAEEMSAAMQMGGADPILIAEQYGAKLEKVAARQALRVRSIGECAQSMVSKIDVSELRPRGLASGISAIDAIIGGFVPGELAIIGARPSNGKTVFGIQTLAYNARKHRRRGLFVSLEMKGEDLAERIVCAAAGISSKRIRSGEVTAEEKARLQLAADGLVNDTIEVFDEGAINVRKIRSLAKRQAGTKGLDMVVIDYVGLIASLDASKPRHEQVGETVQALKDMAKELRVPVIALSQLGRKTGDKAKERPKMSSLRESGKLEEVADLVMILHNPPGEPGFESEIIVEKCRQADTGVIAVDFCKHELRFVDRGYCALMGHASTGEEESNVENF